VSEAASPVIVVAIEVGDPVLADRLASLFGDVDGLRLAIRGKRRTSRLCHGSRKPPSNRLTSTLHPANAMCSC
jgi:hypothetical protein